MDENTVRTLLRAVADAPEPPLSVDVERARRRGLRRLWIRRAAAPLAAMVAVAAIVTVPHALAPGHPERSVASAEHPAISRPLTAPAQFNPLVPYATFGWLPHGFSEAAADDIAMNQGFTAGTDLVGREAADPAAGHLLYLEVDARGYCPFAGATASQAGCLRLAGSEATGKAPAVNGRPGWFYAYGGSITWEYATDAWASLSASITPAADEPHSRRIAAQRGWVLMKRDIAQKMATLSTPAKVRAAIRSGKLIPPSAATRALLVKIASRVAFGQTTRLPFAFRLPGPLPAGWQLSQASFTVSGGRLIGTGITAGPAVDPGALTIGYGPGPCKFFDGQSSYVTRLGIQWLYRVLNEPDKQWENLCTTGTVNGVTGIDVALDMNIPGSNAPLPGSTALGGALGVLSRTRFLGASPAAWTTNPVGSHFLCPRRCL